jgi:hypothetical protein
MHTEHPEHMRVWTTPQRGDHADLDILTFSQSRNTQADHDAYSPPGQQGYWRIMLKNQRLAQSSTRANHASFYSFIDLLKIQGKNRREG